MKSWLFFCVALALFPSRQDRLELAFLVPFAQGQAEQVSQVWHGEQCGFSSPTPCVYLVSQLVFSTRGYIQQFALPSLLLCCRGVSWSDVKFVSRDWGSVDVYRHPRDSCSTMIGPTPWTHGLDVPWWLQVFCALVKVWFVVTEHSAPCDLGWLAKMGGILWLNLILSCWESKLLPCKLRRLNNLNAFDRHIWMFLCCYGCYMLLWCLKSGPILFGNPDHPQGPEMSSIMWFLDRWLSRGLAQLLVGLLPLWRRVGFVAMTQKPWECVECACCHQSTAPASVFFLERVPREDVHSS